MFVKQFCNILLLLWNVLRHTILGALKSLMPSGILPRKSVDGKLVLITGAGSGIGRLMAIEVRTFGMFLNNLIYIFKFGKLGARVVLWDIDEKMNLQTKEMLEDMGIQVGSFSSHLSLLSILFINQSKAYRVDLSERKQIYEAADRVKQEWGNVDILINNAGIVSGKKLFECPDELMEKTMAVNCNALFYVSSLMINYVFLN